MRVKSGQWNHGVSEPEQNSAPKLAKRSLNRKSAILSGRTIGVKRERLETANERMAARKKDKRKSAFRFLLTSCCFLVLAGAVFLLYTAFTRQSERGNVNSSPVQSSEPTVEIVDEVANNDIGSGKITSRMKEYIGRIENCFKERGYQAQKAVIPSSGIREVRIYLDGYEGFIKTIIDRDPAVSVEDADRMIRYLKERGIEDFKYIDVRIDGKAYWK